MFVFSTLWFVLPSCLLSPSCKKSLLSPVLLRQKAPSKPSVLPRKKVAHLAVRVYLRASYFLTWSFLFNEICVAGLLAALVLELLDVRPTATSRSGSLSLRTRLRLPTPQRADTSMLPRSKPSPMLRPQPRLLLSLGWKAPDLPDISALSTSNTLSRRKALFRWHPMEPLPWRCL